MSEIEAELTKITKVLPDKYKNRQDYLAALVRGVDKLPSDDFDNLSDEAYLWHKAAVVEVDKRKTITDFPDLEEEDENEVEEDKEESEEKVAEPENDGESEVDSQLETNEASEPEGGNTALEEVPEEKPKKAKKVVQPANDDRYEKITGEKDRFGITAGSKVSDAVKMYSRPQGATLKEIEDAGLGRQYNILGKLTQAGHKVEKDGKSWKVVHKDDL